MVDILKALKNEIKLEASCSCNAKDKKYIAFAGTANYLSHIGVLISGIVNNNKQENFCFCIFCDEIFEEDQKNFSRLSKCTNQDICFFIIDNTFFQFMKEEKFIPAYLYRLIMPEILFGKCNTFLYLDADINCISELNDLFEKGYDDVIAGVIADKNEKNNSLRLQVDRYFNAGVMLINIKNWQKNDITKKSLSLLQNEKLYYMDQDALNMLLDGQVKFVERKYNYQYSLSALLDSDVAIDEKNFPDDVVFMHFIGESKPWHTWIQNYCAVKLYNKVKEETFWADVSLVKAKTYKQLHKEARSAKKEKRYKEMVGWYLKYACKKVLCIIKGV